MVIWLPCGFLPPRAVLLPSFYCTLGAPPPVLPCSCFYVPSALRLTGIIIRPCNCLAAGRLELTSIICALLVSLQFLIPSSAQAQFYAGAFLLAQFTGI